MGQKTVACAKEKERIERGKKRGLGVKSYPRPNEVKVVSQASTPLTATKPLWLPRIGSVQDAASCAAISSRC